MLLRRYENSWNPLKELEAIQNHLTGALGLPSASTPIRTVNDEKLQQPSWTPLVDVLEDGKEYLIKLETPEVKKEEITVKVQDGVLRVEGERKQEREDKSKRYHRVERLYGHFSRCFALPDDADTEKVSAEYADGILRIRVAKTEKPQPRQIEVRVA